MKIEEFAKMAGRLKKALVGGPDFEDQETLMIWYRPLRHIEVEAFSDVCKHLIEWNKFFPVVSEILQTHAGISEQKRLIQEQQTKKIDIKPMPKNPELSRPYDTVVAYNSVKEYEAAVKKLEKAF